MLHDFVILHKWLCEWEQISSLNRLFYASSGLNVNVRVTSHDRKLDVIQVRTDSRCSFQQKKIVPRQILDCDFVSADDDTDVGSWVDNISRR